MKFGRKCLYMTRFSVAVGRLDAETVCELLNTVDAQSSITITNLAKG